MGVVRREVSDRSIFGKLVKWTFIAFNILMILWAVSFFNMVRDDELGIMVGMLTLLIIWALGDFILGMFVLFTRRKKMIETEN